MVLTTVGVLLVVLPDSGPRLVSLSTEHGPGITDTVGILLLLAGFGIILRVIGSHRAAWIGTLSSSLVLLASSAFLSGLGSGLLVAGLVTGFWWRWLIGAIILQGVWLLLRRLALIGKVALDYGLIR